MRSRAKPGEGRVGDEVAQVGRPSDGVGCDDLGVEPGHAEAPALDPAEERRDVGHRSRQFLVDLPHRRVVERVLDHEEAVDVEALGLFRGDGRERSPVVMPLEVLVPGVE